MSARQNVVLALLSVGVGLAAWAYSATLYTPENVCGPMGGEVPSSAPLRWAFLSLLLGTTVLAGLSMALELRRRIRGVRHGELEDAAVSVAVFGPALAGLAIAVLVFRPAICF